MATAGDWVYAGAFNRGGEGDLIYASNDGGTTWNSVLTIHFPWGVARELSIDPDDPLHVVAGGMIQDDTNPDQPIDQPVVYGTADGVSWSP